MTLEELVAEFRVRARDEALPHMWADDAVTRWLNEAEREACIRGRLLRETSNPVVCQIALQPGVATYPLHESVYEITYLCIVPLVGPTQPLDLVSREWLDRSYPRWREDLAFAHWAFQDDTSLTLAAKHKAGDLLELECYRIPLDDMEDEDDEPEIHSAHHAHLVDWALHRAFSVPDAEGFDPTRAALSEAAFTRYFGPLPDSDLRRLTREDVVHHNEAILP